MIETVNAHSGAIELKVCCSSIMGDVGEAAFTPDGEAIANAGQWPGLWDARSGQYLGRLPTDSEPRVFRPVAFDENRGLVLMGSSTGAVWAWDWNTRRLKGGARATVPLVGNVDTLTVSPAGWVIFAGTIVSMWSPGARGVVSWPESRPTSNLVLSPDGRSLLFGKSNGQIEFWDLAKSRPIRRIQFPER
jgi:WD40 repeat protein